MAHAFLRAVSGFRARHVFYRHGFVRNAPKSTSDIQCRAPEKGGPGVGIADHACGAQWKSWLGISSETSPSRSILRART